MRKIGVVLAAIALAVATVGNCLAVTAPAMAENEFTKEACSAGLSAEQKEALGCSQNNSAPNVAINLIKVVIGIIGLVAVVMIIVAGAKYMTSQGDPGQLQQAKNMIVYAIVGLVVAILAFAIVVFVENLVLNAANGAEEATDNVGYVELSTLLKSEED